mgnify:CR=1 FL=1|tara:strand:+ start:585 stop:1121 length:537 start_codon:yes stop_codon:yes gene_type:complete
MKDYRKFFKQILEQQINEEEKEEEVDVETEETGDETEETGDETETTEEPEEDEDASNEEGLIKIFEDESFVDAFKNSTKQYVSEKILDEEYNSFTIIPLIETEYKDETYALSIEFSSLVSINVNEDGEVVDKNISNVETIKYKTPTMDNMALLEDETAKGLVELSVVEALDNIKKVPR